MLWSKRSAQQIHQTTKAIVVPSSTGTTLIRTQKALKTRVLFTYFISISVVPKELGQQIHQLLNTIPVLSPTGKTLIWTQKTVKTRVFCNYCFYVSVLLEEIGTTNTSDFKCEPYRDDIDFNSQNTQNMYFS